ncbi:MAG: hypothetical protein ACRBFS_11685 [Aureispira sp.]
MTPIKSKKEIQLAALTYSRALEQQKVEDIEGQFFAADTGFLYKKQQQALAYCLAMTSLCIFMLVYIIVTEANYYAQLDSLVLACCLFWLSLVGISAWLFKQYLTGSQHLQMVLNNPNKSSFGVLLTKDYYFECLPGHYHIIPKANIIRIDYEQQRENGEIYLELLLDLEEQYEVRGILYRPEEYDLKKWIGEPSA